MMLPEQTLIDILRAGASLRVDAMKTPIEMLIRLTLEADRGAGYVTVSNACKLDRGDLLVLAQFGGRSVEFDMT